MSDFSLGPPTRAEGFKRLEEFLPRAGRDYAQGRNFDYGPADRSNVSGLSPWIRHRLIREDEVVAAVLDHHSASDAQKFLQEVCWRTYWKGWLELRPSVWTSYRQTVDDLMRDLDRDSSLFRRWQEATEGRAGIACFDAWAQELVSTGYLHNHARMWFASIWIFTLGLPWVLGADFFLRHLLDGDPASNTLSWRWVAGLQTRGKTYLARASNIAEFTDGRFQPAEVMADEALPLQEPPPPRPRRLPERERPNPSLATGLLITEEDLHPESLGLKEAGITPVAIAGFSAVSDRSPLPVGALAQLFATGALHDASSRASHHFELVHIDNARPHFKVGQLLDWARAHGLVQVVTAYAPTGPAQELLQELDTSFQTQGLRLVQVRRDWDETLWPEATHGFFPFKEKLPRRLQELLPAAASQVRELS